MVTVAYGSGRLRELSVQTGFYKGAVVTRAVRKESTVSNVLRTVVIIGLAHEWVQRRTTNKHVQTGIGGDGGRIVKLISKVLERTVFNFLECYLLLGYIGGRVTLGTLGKLFITTSFDAIYVFSAELFPTVVRYVTRKHSNLKL